MSLKSKIEAVIYASEEPVTLQQLVGLLAEEAQSEIDEIASSQTSLPLEGDVSAGEADSSERMLPEAAMHKEPPQAQAAEEAEIAPGIAAAAEGDDSESQVAAEQAPDDEKRRNRDRERAVRDHVRRAVDQLMREYAESDRGIEIREVASGFRMGTKPEYHDAVRGFVKSLKPALKLTLPALETLAVVAYKQPVTAAEISEIRGVDSAGVLGGLMARKLIATAGRKQVIGRPMLYKTTRDFLLRFGLKDVQELPSMEEFERMAGELAEQEDLPMDGTDTIIEQANVRGDAEMIRDANAAGKTSTDEAEEKESSSTENNDNYQDATAEIAAGGTDEEAHEQHTKHTALPGEFQTGQADTEVEEAGAR